MESDGQTTSVPVTTHWGPGHICQQPGCGKCQNGNEAHQVLHRHGLYQHCHSPSAVCEGVRVSEDSGGRKFGTQPNEWNGRGGWGGVGEDLGGILGGIGVRLGRDLEGIGT